MENNRTLLLTGGLGFIGSNVIVELLNSDYNVIVIDNLSNSDVNIINKIKTITGKTIKFYAGDIKNKTLLNDIFSNNNIYAVIHLASLKAVNESIKVPLEYYENNTSYTIKLLKIMQKYDCKKIIFSSSASVYGFQPSPITENAITGVNLSNPYAKTKYMIEEILKDVYESDKSWSIVILRYFNPIGTHETGLLGDLSKNATNIFPKLVNAFINNEKFIIYGNDYDTNDGTCVRDYIHITDLAKAHVKVINKLNTYGINIYNVGTNYGTSVIQLLETFIKVNNIKINYEFGKKREGDISCLYASAEKIYKETGWKAEKTLKDMCKLNFNEYIS